MLVGHNLFYFMLQHVVHLYIIYNCYYYVPYDDNNFYQIVELRQNGVI